MRAATRPMRVKVATEARVLTIIGPVNAWNNHISKAQFLGGMNRVPECDAHLSVDWVKAFAEHAFIASK